MILKQYALCRRDYRMLSYIALLFPANISFPANIAQTSANIGVDAPTAHYDASAEFMGIGVSFYILDHTWGHILTSFTKILIFITSPVDQNVYLLCRCLLE